MSEPEIARDAAAFMRWCVSDWTSDCEAIRKALGKRRVWRSVEEWRISTVTEESIESSGSGFAIVSSCDATWRGAVPSLDEALKVRMLFWSFHVELFYSLGWPSWAAANRMEADEPGARMRNGDARRYLARLSDAAAERSAQLGRDIPQEGGNFVARVALDPVNVESVSPTRERAAQFQGVYEQLVADAVAFLAAHH